MLLYYFNLNFVYRHILWFLLLVGWFALHYGLHSTLWKLRFLISNTILSGNVFFWGFFWCGSLLASGKWLFFEYSGLIYMIPKYPFYRLQWLVLRRYLFFLKLIGILGVWCFVDHWVEDLAGVHLDVPPAHPRNQIVIFKVLRKKLSNFCKLTCFVKLGVFWEGFFIRHLIMLLLTHINRNWAHIWPRLLTISSYRLLV